MSRIKKIALGLAGMIAVMRLARHAENWMRYAERADANPPHLGYREARRKMGQGRLHQARIMLHDPTASMAEREAAAIILGYDSAEEALLPENIGKYRPITRATISEASEAEVRILGYDTVEGAIHSAAYDAVCGNRLKPTAPPSFPGESDKVDPSRSQD